MTELAALPPPAANTPIDSWQPINLTSLDLAPREQPTLASGLAYPGRRHLWSGEPESAKSWAALIACTQQLQDGQHTIYIDFETNEHETLDRLQCLGLDDYEISLLLYIKPTDPIGAQGVREHLDQLLATHQPTIVVVDAYAGALDLHDLDPNKGADIERLNRVLFEPLRAHGAAVIILDHLTKNKDTRGKFAIGSERKVGVVDVHLGFETVKPFGRGRSGLIHIKTHKDRPGYMPRPRAADLELHSDPDTGHITYELKAPQQTDDAHPFRPTALMEKVSRYLEHVAQPASRYSIEQDISGKREWVRIAIDTLAREGYASESEGPRNARIYTSIQPFREAEDDLAPRMVEPNTVAPPDNIPTSNQENPLTDLAPPRPHLAPGEVNDLAPTLPPPIGGRGEVTDNPARSPRPANQDELTPPQGADDDIPF